MSGGVLINIIILGVSSITHFLKIDWLDRLIPNINATYITQSLVKVEEYSNIKYSLIYMVLIIILLYVLSIRASKKHLEIINR